MGTKKITTALACAIALLFGVVHAQVPAGLPEGHPDISGKEMPADHGGMPPFEVSMVELPPLDVAVIKGKLGGEIPLLFASLVAAAVEQDLWTDKNELGAIFPYAMELGWDLDTEIWVGVSLAPGQVASEPLFAYTIPGGEYLMVLHTGPYEESEATWRAAFAWAEEHGIEFAKAPAVEHYLDNPEEVAAEELRCEIYIPLVPGQGHDGMEQHHGGDDVESVTGEADAAPGFNVSVENLPQPVYLAYIEGTASDDFGMEISAAVAEAAGQGLLGSDGAKVAAVYPDAMANGYDENTPVYFGVGLDYAPDVEAPLDVYEVPVGDYLFAEHYGDYSGLGDFWIEVFAWATGHGIEFGDGPCAEIYISDPQSTPVDEVLTLIVIPVAPGQDHPEMDGEAPDDQSADIPDPSEFSFSIEEFEDPAYLACILGFATDDFDTMISTALDACTEQGLTGGEFSITTVYPDMLSNGFTDTTPVLCGIRLENSTPVSAPLDLFELAAGRHLVVAHTGPYTDIGYGWMAAYEWAAEQGVEFSNGPAGEVYSAHPFRTADDELVSLIIIPLADEV